MGNKPYNFFDTKKYELNEPLYYFLSFCLGVFIFRVIETFKFTGNKSACTYYTRTIFRYLLMIRIFIKLFGYIFELRDLADQQFLQCWLTFFYNEILIIAVVMLEKSFQDFIRYIGKELRFSSLTINIAGTIYFIINTCLLLGYAVTLGMGKKALAEHLYSAYQILIIVAVSVFVHSPLIKVFWDVYKNDYGSQFATRVIMAVIFLAVTIVFAVGTIIIRVSYSFACIPSLGWDASSVYLIKSTAMWVASIYELLISATQTIMDYMLERILPSLSESVSEATSSIIADTI